MLWDHIPDANCSGVKGEHCSVDVAPGGHVMTTVYSYTILYLQYVRVDHLQKMDTVLTLLKDAWHMDAPNLLISVTGGAKNFKMLPRLKEMFRRGLINVAKSTGNTTCTLATQYITYTNC